MAVKRSAAGGVVVRQRALRLSALVPSRDEGALLVRASD